MSFDFDTPVERRGTDSQKWQKYASRDILPMWVADMDFRSPPAVIEALQKRAAEGVFGYARPVATTVESVLEMLESRFNWRVEAEWLVWLPGLVVGLNLTSRAFAQAGEGAITATPIYPPFMSAPQFQERTAFCAPMLRDAHGRYELDFEALETIGGDRARLLLLCNPHNPVGRVYSRAELERVAEICAKRNLVLCSDEIHCDLILEPSLEHIPAATLSPEVANRTITLMAPSKTYNIPGLGCSFAIISDPELRRRFERAGRGVTAEVNPFGYVAAEAAYRHGEPWRQALLGYLRGNRDFLAYFLRRELPEIQLTPLDATYLAWLNVEALGLPNAHAFFEQAGVGLSDGAWYSGPGHLRMNLGCTRATLTEALERMRRAVRSR
jgi:cysteine-S-conjugate beta-lyase